MNPGRRFEIPIDMKKGRRWYNECMIAVKKISTNRDFKSIYIIVYFDLVKRMCRDTPDVFCSFVKHKVIAHRIDSFKPFYILGIFTNQIRTWRPYRHLEIHVRLSKVFDAHFHVDIMSLYFGE